MTKESAEILDAYLWKLLKELCFIWLSYRLVDLCANVETVLYSINHIQNEAIIDRITNRVENVSHSDDEHTEMSLLGKHVV